MLKKKKKKENTASNTALTPTAAKSPHTKPQQAAVCVSAIVRCKQKKDPFFD
jgi:hypothetical protein